MARDYAKKGRSKSRGASRHGDRIIPLPLLIFTGFLLVSFLSGLAYLKWFVDPVENNQKQTPKTVQSQKTEKKSDNQTKDSTVPVYNLHDDLTNKEVEISDDDLNLSENQDRYYYTMSCGSFRDESRADELKALIALTGNNSTIKTVNVQGTTFYRVELGPFNRKRAAESIRHRLEDNDIRKCSITQFLANK
ncbi:MAG: SPOR domain-containing protein [Gammaproteobacteria bacterium]|nr:SPOR domain-containing protein [Gammaproteobacteria bacterium]MDH5629490.1 SPOR domain-containing protein [Gammaproteobacteria bacterium]